MWFYPYTDVSYKDCILLSILRTCITRVGFEHWIRTPNLYHSRVTNFLQTTGSERQFESYILAMDTALIGLVGKTFALEWQRSWV